MTFKKYADFYMQVKENEELKPSSLYRYQGIIDNYILPFFISFDLATCNKVSTIRQFLLKLKELSPSGHVSPKTKKTIISVLTGILQEAYYDEAIQVNGAKKIPPTKVIKPDINPFASHEAKLLIQNANGWFKAFLAISFYTGLRTGECMALHVSDIDLKNNIIRINKSRGKFGVSTPKTKGSIRELPIFEPLKAILIPFLKQHDNNFLFVNQYGDPFNDSKSILKYHFYPLLERCNLQKRVMYQTRHTFASNMLESGKFSVTEISRFLGHVNTQMVFQRYTAFIESEKRRNNIAIDIYDKSQK